MNETLLLAAEAAIVVGLFAFVWVVARSSARSLKDLERLHARPTLADAEPVRRAVPLPPPPVADVGPSAPADTAEAPLPPTPSVAEVVGEAPPADAFHDTGMLDLSAANLRPHLTVEASGAIPVGMVVELEGGVTIGRSRSSQLCIEDSFVSHMHARIFRRGPFYFIEDLGSTNGTFINGRRIDGQGQLKVHDELRMGETVLRYEE
ncbi:MAG: FHA domain-containing protein [Actinobacteria bacterium]|nr:FHA domain-containing protein [Actinomycetota bacterium]